MLGGWMIDEGFLKLHFIWGVLNSEQPFFFHNPSKALNPTSSFEVDVTILQIFRYPIR